MFFFKVKVKYKNVNHFFEHSKWFSVKASDEDSAGKYACNALLINFPVGDFIRAEVVKVQKV